MMTWAMTNVRRGGLALLLVAACHTTPPPTPMAPPPPGTTAEPTPPTGAALLTWTPEQQLFGFRNMEKLAPAAVVAHGERVHALPVAATQLAPTITLNGTNHDLGSYMATMRTTGVLVLQDGQIVVEQYALGRTAADRWTSFSVAKSVTSTLIGAAIKDGFITSLDDMITRYLPALSGSAYEVVSIRDLITMRSGVAWNEDYTDLESDVAKVGLAPPVGGENSVVTYMRALPRAAAPGTVFNYNTGETDLAGVLLSAAVGKPLAQYLSEKIWVPYGMEQDAIWILDSAGHERGGCCMSMTLRDYARFGQFMLDGGKANGVDVLPPTWIADATSAQVASPPYGYFWWIGAGGAYAAVGIFGQSITVVPALRLVIAVNSAWPAAWTPALSDARTALVTGIVDAAATAAAAPR